MSLPLERNVPSPTVLACLMRNAARTCYFTGITPRACRAMLFIVHSTSHTSCFSTTARRTLCCVTGPHNLAWAAPDNTAVEGYGTKSGLFWQMAHGNTSKEKSCPEDKTAQGLQRGQHLYQVWKAVSRGLQSPMCCLLQDVSLRVIWVSL